MHKIIRSTCREQQLARAYLLLLFVPENEDGFRTVSLARYGNYDVRVVEFAYANTVADTKSLWIELYAHDRQIVLDSCRRDEVEDAAIAAEALILRARQLDEEFVASARLAARLSNKGDRLSGALRRNGEGAGRACYY